MKRKTSTRSHDKEASVKAEVICTCNLPIVSSEADMQS